MNYEKVRRKLDLKAIYGLMLSKMGLYPFCRKMQVENVKKVSSLSPALAAVLGRCAAEPLRENFIKETDVGIACPEV